MKEPVLLSRDSSLTSASQTLPIAKALRFPYRHKLFSPVLRLQGRPSQNLFRYHSRLCGRTFRVPCFNEQELGLNPVLARKLVPLSADHDDQSSEPEIQASIIFLKEELLRSIGQ
jgi:hypothetical protein